MRKFTSVQETQPKIKSNLKILILLGAVVLGLTIGVLYYFYDELYANNVNLPAGQEGFIYIPTGSSHNDVIYQVAKSGYINDMQTLQRAMRRLSYGGKIYPGRFKVTRGMSNKQIVRILASNMQTPVDMVIPSVRTRERLVGAIAKQIEPDSISLLLSLKNEDVAKKYGFNTENFSCMFIPNSYQMYWNINLNSFLDRMNKEWEAFWSSNNRESKLKKVGLSRTEAVILASIICEETNMYDEMPTIAGVYINRLRKGMRLQADPTVRFAVGDFSMRRVLTVHTKISNPYNTYRVHGLPPGPICIPNTRVIDAVLNFEKHNYLYFCAKADFSGYHSFAKTYGRHLELSQEYQRALNQMQVYR
jgi:UPF0755 protein